ncbi:MAG: hypothetical protein QOK43_1996 [Acidimicrobiaceae bacterium]|nr:hypothetical protein [Acidimicrobiaceae bacterium]
MDEEADQAEPEHVEDAQAAEHVEHAGQGEDLLPVPVPKPPVRRRSRSLIAAGLMGVEQALYGHRQNEIVMVADAGGMPEPDFDIDLTPDPRDSTVVLRKHRRRKG